MVVQADLSQGNAVGVVYQLSQSGKLGVIEVSGVVWMYAGGEGDIRIGTGDVASVVGFVDGRGGTDDVDESGGAGAVERGCQLVAQAAVREVAMGVDQSHGNIIWAGAAVSIVDWPSRQKA